MPVWNKEKDTQKTGTFYFILPHEYLFSMITDVESWCDLGDQINLIAHREAWSIERGIQDLVDRIIACGLWGDSAPFTEHDSLYLLLFNILSGPKSDRIWITCFPKSLCCQCGCKGKCTFTPIWEVLAWSFEALLLGQLPYKRHDNIHMRDSEDEVDRTWRKSLAGLKFDFRAAVLQKRGDWQWLKQALNLIQWKHGGGDVRMCWKCGCTAALMREFSLSAPWRNTILTHNAFLEDMMRRGEGNMPLLRIPGFQVDYIVPDLMHCGCLGVVLTLLGNLLFEFFKENGGLVTNPRAGLSRLLNMINMAKAAIHGADTINNLSWGMIKRDHMGSTF